MKKLKFNVALIIGLFVLTACSQTGEVPDITSSSPGLWQQFVYFFARMIEQLSFGGLIGVGIILFTLLLRVVLLPLYNIQIKSGQKLQALQPELRNLQAKYPGKDMDSRVKLSEETQALYKAYGVNPFASLWPLLIQLPILMALFRALTRVAFLREGHFLWLELAKPDPYFILPVLAAIFTFLSSWLTSRANPNRDGMSTAMTYMAPIMILLFAIPVASGVALYWTVSNAFQVVQVLVFNNPFKIIAEREAAQQAIREREAKIRRAKKKAMKRK